MSTESGSLNESLKALRVLHQLLMVAAFGVLVLGLTPDQTRHYNSALDELQALRTIRQPMDQEYGAYLGKQVSASEDDKELLLTMARATGANVPKDIEISQPFTSDFAFVGSYFMDLDSFFGRVHKITRFKLANAKTIGPQVQFLNTQLAIQNPSHQKLSLESIRFDAVGLSELRGGVLIVDSRNLPANGRVSGQFEFRFVGSDTVKPLSISIGVPGSYSLGRVQEGRFALDWLQSLPAGPSLVDSGTKVVFPSLKKLSFWNTIRLKDFDGAASYIRQRLDSANTETVSFFGISVNKSVALWVGPVVCFAIE